MGPYLAVGGGLQAAESAAVAFCSQAQLQMLLLGRVSTLQDHLVTLTADTGTGQ